MNRSTLDLWVGIFVTIGLGAILFLALKVGNLTSFSNAPGYRVEARFDNIGGLKLRAPVKAAGVVVGRVEKIRLDPADLPGGGHDEDRPRLRVHRRHHRVDPDLGPARRGLHRPRRRRRHQDARRRREDQQDAVGDGAGKADRRSSCSTRRRRERASERGACCAPRRARVAAVAATALLRRLRDHGSKVDPLRADEPGDVRRPRGRRRQRRPADRAGLRRLRARAPAAAACPTSSTTSTTSSPAINGLLQGKLDEGRRRPRPGDGQHRCSGWAASSTSASDIGIERGNEDFGQTFGLLGPPGRALPVRAAVRAVDRARRRAATSCASSGVPSARFPTCRCATRSTGWATSNLRAAALGTRARSSTPRRSTATSSSAMPTCSGAATWSTTASRRRNPRKNR